MPRQYKTRSFTQRHYIMTAELLAKMRPKVGDPGVHTQRDVERLDEYWLLVVQSFTSMFNADSGGVFQPSRFRKACGIED